MDAISINSEPPERTRNDSISAPLKVIPHDVRLGAPRPRRRPGRPPAYGPSHLHSNTAAMCGGFVITSFTLGARRADGQVGSPLCLYLSLAPTLDYVALSAPTARGEY